ncbi:hypothetical protein [Microbacterium sp. RU33B]|uniref:hypothetical protein n=1 Tax=Microbacterium sp. RU33B TaxID=1907390 RepID=UPI0009637F78|nr:hypothetical protein [Microbacterium sp. RU33B]SIT72486.1 hypothetical protein SAMN05880545_1061 [Microbacterium sp. RU33B]
MTADSPTKPTAKRNPLGFGGATFLVVAAASTVTQMIAVASLGLPVALEWSTGGLVALVAGIWMGALCKSWASWRRWIWLPVGITVVVAFVTVNLVVGGARAEAERVAEEEHAAMCAQAQTDLAGMQTSHSTLLDQVWAAGGGAAGARPAAWVPIQGEGGGWREALTEGEGGSWRDIAREGGAYVPPGATEMWSVYLQAGGPQLESDLADFEAAYAAECTATE